MFQVSSEEQFESDMPMCADSSIHVSLIKVCMKYLSALPLFIYFFLLCII